jgi:hypothetical protein
MSLAMSLFIYCYSSSNGFNEGSYKELWRHAKELSTICDRVSPKGMDPPFCVLDEAQVLSQGDLKDAFRVVGDRKRRGPDRKHSDGKRPILSPFLDVLYSVVTRPPLVAGTGITLMKEYKTFASRFATILSGDKEYSFVDFPIFMKKTISDLLTMFLGLEGETLEMGTGWLIGRPRFIFEFLEICINSTQTLKEDETSNKFTKERLNAFIEYMTKSESLAADEEPKTPGQSAQRVRDTPEIDDEIDATIETAEDVTVDKMDETGVTVDEKEDTADKINERRDSRTPFEAIQGGLWNTCKS